jgi:hypothetical protein
MINL